MIDGMDRSIEDQDIQRARGQLYLSSDFHLVGATRWLQVDTGNGQARVSLPSDLYFAVFETANGRREYGVISLARQTLA